MARRKRRGPRSSGVDGLESKSDIRQWLLESYDPAYAQHLYALMKYAFGDDYEPKELADAPEGAVFLEFPAIKTRWHELGRSRMILNTQYIQASKAMYSEPEIQCPQVDKLTGEIRKQYYLKRYRGSHYADGEWHQEMLGAYMDGDGLGFGCVQIGLRTSEVTGEQQTDIRHSPAVDTIGDTNSPNPGRWRRIAFCHRVPLDVAYKLFPRDVVDKYRREVHDSLSQEVRREFRYFEYFSVGVGGKRPTRALIPHDLSEEPTLVEENIFGCLPMSYYLHCLFPGMKRPVGRISLQMASQATLNDIEKGMRREARRPGYDIGAVDDLEEADMKRVNAGEQGVIVRWTQRPGVSGAPIHRIPGGEVSQTNLKLYEIFYRQYMTDAGTTEMERGNTVDQAETLGEIQLLDARAEQAGSLGDSEVLRLHIRTATKVLKIAEIGDTDPLWVDVFGRNFLLNDPAVPESALALWLAEPSDILIDARLLRARDERAERHEELQELAFLSQWVGVYFDHAWFAERLVRALGDTDATPALMGGGTMQAVQQGGGVPAQQPTQTV